MSLTTEQKKRRIVLLQKLYSDGYRYIAATSTGGALAGKEVTRKATFFGVWSMTEAIIVRPTLFEEDLFPDVKWEDEEPLNIEIELEKSKRSVSE